MSNPMPDLGPLQIVVGTVTSLNGERHAPDLPLPRSKVEDYAGRLGFGLGFVALVAWLDREMLSARQAWIERAKMKGAK